MTGIAVRQGDVAAPRSGERLPVTLVLDRLRSAFNVGNIFRLADAVQAEQIVACGYTPSPPHPKLSKTAMGSELAVVCRTAETAASALASLRAGGHTIYGVETAASARSVWDVRLHFPAVLVFGNEALGITPEALAECDHFISLPALGCKNSINVSNCAAVVVFEALRQWRQAKSPATTS